MKEVEAKPLFTLICVKCKKEIVPERKCSCPLGSVDLVKLEEVRREAEAEVWAQLVGEMIYGVPL